jgi:hypothetical protein
MVFVHHHCIICHITVGIIPYYIQYWPIDLHLAHAICNLHLVTLRFGKTMCEWNTDGLINTPHWQKPCNCHLYAWKYSDSIYERLSVYTPLTFALHMSWEMKATFWENSIICVNVYWYNYSNERHCIPIVTRMLCGYSSFRQSMICNVSCRYPPYVMQCDYLATTVLYAISLSDSLRIIYDIGCCFTTTVLYAISLSGHLCIIYDIGCQC